MILNDHHLSTLGLLADIQGFLLDCPESKDHDSFIGAIDECISDAEEQGLPVSVERLRNGDPICTLENN